MNKNTRAALFITALAVNLIACTKSDILQPATPVPGKDTTGAPKPSDPVPATGTSFNVNIKAFAEVGTVLYDSIAAAVSISSWDSAGIEHRSELSLNPGSNTIRLDKKFPRFRFTLHTWGIEKTMDFTREQLMEGQPVLIGAKREPKRLRSESTELLIQGQWRPSSQRDYYYNSNGSLKSIDYYQKKPQSADLLKYWVDQFEYSGQQVVKITRQDDTGKPVVFTAFTYYADGSLQNISQDSYGSKTYAYVQKGIDTQHEIIDVDYLFDNGNAMTYTMKFRNGNKISENATSSTGSGEGGNFSYDQHINPYHQLNWPDMYFRNSSKNNPVDVDKAYGGNIPSAVVYKTVYTYDADGYPVQVIKSYKGYSSGEHLYDQKTLFFY